MAQNDPNVMTDAQQKINDENDERPTKFTVQQFGQARLKHIRRI